MTPNVEKIIEQNNKQYEQFCKHQQKRIAELRKMNAEKAMGKRVNTTHVVNNLKSAGILDKKGDLAKPYSDGA
jgi:hypothetical protein